MVEKTFLSFFLRFSSCPECLLQASPGVFERCRFEALVSSGEDSEERGNRLTKNESQFELNVKQ